MIWLNRHAHKITAAAAAAAAAARPWHSEVLTAHALATPRTLKKKNTRTSTSHSRAMRTVPCWRRTRHAPR
jgi:hypothetical protein